MFIHVEEQSCCHIGHALNIANIRSVDSESLQDALELVIVDSTHLEEPQHWESPGNVSLNYTDTLLPALHSISIGGVSLKADQQTQLFLEFLILL
jgi:hypothetical protein